MQPDCLLTGREAREHLARARLMLLFSPELCLGRPPLDVLEAALPALDVVQVRPKPRAAAAASLAPCPAREAWDWCLRIVDLLRARRGRALVLLVDDRADVARVGLAHGIAGVHLGQDDQPAAQARELLGPQALIGLSTHSEGQVSLARAESVDYLGFGPVFPSATKGYARGLGAAACRSASGACALPLFPIGGIERKNVRELAGVGRAAVSSAILAAEDPGRAAAELRELLARPVEAI